MNQLTVDDILSILIDALDVDLQIYSGKVLERLRTTKAGVILASWAEAHPSAFESLLRGFSVVAQRIPRDDSLLRDTLRDQLSRLPVEIKRAFTSDGKSNMIKLLSDPEFERKYEEALNDVSEDEADYVASLSSDRLEEWVRSPRKIRPHKLAAWKNERTLSQTFKDIDRFLGETVAPELEKLNERLEKKYKLRKK